MNEDLVRYRLEDAKEKLESAKILLRANKFKDCISRSYYSMFSAARALLTTKSLDSPKHSGVISLFNQHFVKSGIISKELGKLLAQAKDAREKGDYGDFVIFSKEEVEKQVETAEFLIKKIEVVLERILKGKIRI